MHYMLCGVLYLSVLGIHSNPTLSNKTRIVGGRDAIRGAYPWQVSIQVKYEDLFDHHCGGSVINNRWILSAAHCFRKVGIEYRIVTGEYDLDINEGTEQYYSIIKEIKHEEFDEAKGLNDICLLKMDRQIDFSSYVQAIPILSPPQDGSIQVDDTCIASGWGSWDHGPLDPNILQVVDLPIWSLEDCQHVYGNDNVTDSTVCAGSEGKDACKRDSGGPLVCALDGRYQLLGVTSWGKGCGLLGYPGVYAKVPFFHYWIKKTLQMNSVD